MGRVLARAIVVAVAALAVGSTSFAFDLNGFLKSKGHGDLAISYTAESYDHFWMGETKIPNSAPGLGEVDNRSLSLWLGYGLTDDLTLFATLPYVETESDTAPFDESGLQDASVLAAYRFFESQSSVRHDLIGAVGLRTPASSYEADQPVAIGDSTTDWLLRVVYMLRTRGFYWSQQIGFDIRGEDAPDGWPIFTELGYSRGRMTYNLYYSSLVVSDGSDIGDAGFTFPGNREEYSRAGAKVFGRINDRFGLAASVFDTLDGRNTGDSSGLSLGVVIGF